MSTKTQINSIGRRRAKIGLALYPASTLELWKILLVVWGEVLAWLTISLISWLTLSYILLYVCSTCKQDDTIWIMGTTATLFIITRLRFRTWRATALNLGDIAQQKKALWQAEADK